MTGDFVLDALRARLPARIATGFPRHRFRLHAMLTTAGCDRAADPSYRHEGSTRGPFVLLQHTLAGTGRLQHGNTRHILRPGQTMLLRFPHDCRYWVEPGESWEFFWIALNGREPTRIWREAMAAGPVVRLAGDAIPRLAGICLRALDGFEDAAAASSLAYDAAMVVARHLVLAREAGALLARRDGIERALSACDAETARLDVGRLAEASGYSRHHFSRVFAAATGLPPGRFMLVRRMEEAARLLRVTDLPVKTVARRCGFNDANNFAKAFRRHHGAAPRRFRSEGGAPPRTPPGGAPPDPPD